VAARAAWNIGGQRQVRVFRVFRIFVARLALRESLARSRVVCVLRCGGSLVCGALVKALGALGTGHAHSHTSTQARLCSCAAGSAPPRARAFIDLRLSFAHRPNSTDSRTRPPSAHTPELHLSRPRSNLGHVPRGYTHPHGHAQHRSALCREDGSHPSEHLNHISYSHPNAHS
jgi:hypothetical protein